MKYLIFIILLLLTTSCIDTEAVDILFEADDIILNSQVVVGNDTLDVIKTHWFSNSVTLSNNIEYDWGYVETKFVSDSTLIKLEEIKNKCN